MLFRSGEATVALDGADIRVVGVLAPNPHAVAFIGNLDTVGVLDQPPRLEPATAFPDGANVEFVERVGPAHMRMRVHERGVGETLSCGTGACAVAWAARRQPGASDAAEYRVDVLGGSLYVREAADGHVWLIGPATLVAHGHIDSALLAGCA